MTLWQVPELVPDEILEKSGASVARAAFARVPLAKPAQLVEADAVIVAVQIGVGGLATAVVQHYRSSAMSHKPKIVGVEPLKAACVLASVRANKIVAVPGPHDSIMAGLKYPCWTKNFTKSPPALFWPAMSITITFPSKPPCSRRNIFGRRTQSRRRKSSKTRADFRRCRMFRHGRSRRISDPDRFSGKVFFAGEEKRPWSLRSL